MNGNLRDIVDWVKDHFKNNSTSEEQDFNVYSYSKGEKEDAIGVLESLGYNVSLESNNNNLKVIK